MFMLTIFTLMVMSTTMLFLANTPIMLGINILMMALLLSATLAISSSSWYALLVFLIYVGGMLVMFAYFLALSPNQQMPTSSNILYSMITTVTLLTVMIITNTKPLIPESLYQNSQYLYSYNSSPMLIVLALILLLTMLIVVKLTYRSKGPLRPFNYV